MRHYDAWGVEGGISILTGSHRSLTRLQSGQSPAKGGREVGMDAGGLVAMT